MTVSRAKNAIPTAAVFVIALALRVTVLVQLSGVPLFRTPQLDSLEYLEWAQKIASGDFSYPATPIHGPGYPIVLGALLAITRSLAAARIVQAILGSFTAVLILLIARKVYGRRAGLIAGLLAAAYGPLILIEVSILGEGLLLLLLTLTVWISTAEPPTRARSIVAGLAFGFAAVVRPTALVLAPIFIRRTRLFLFALFAAYAVLPVMYQHWASTGDLVVVQTSGGFNFYLGNSTTHDGTPWARPGGEWDWARGAAWRAGVRGAADEDRFYVQEAFRDVRAHPLRFARLLGTKALWLIQTDEIRDSHAFAFFTSHSTLLRWLPGFGIVFALAAAGIATTLRERPRSWMILGWLILMSGAVLLLVIGMRYRMPIMPPLFMLAGAGTDAILRAAETRQRRLFLVLFSTAALAFACTHIRRHEPSHDLTEERAMNALALLKERDLTAARAQAAQTASANPRSSLAWLTLGDVEASRGAWPEAEQAWRRAIAADRRTARAWSHLAFAFMRRGDRGNAERALLQAIAIKEEREAIENLQKLRSGGR